MATDSGTRVVNLNSSLHAVNSGQTLSAPSGSSSNDVEFNGDGSEVAAADGDGTVRVYKTATAKEVATLDAGHGVPDSVAIGPGDKLIAAGYSSGAAIVWDTSTDTQLTQLTGNEGSVGQVQFGAAGQEVVTASSDGTVRVWHAQPRELAGAFSTSDSDQSGAPNPVYSAEYSPDGSRILAVDASGFANVLTANGTPVASVGPLASTVYVNTAVYNRAGTEIVTADSDGTVDTWSVGGSYPQITPASPIKVDGGPALYAAFSPNGKSIVVTTSDGTAEVFNAQTGQRLHVLSNPASPYLFSMAVFSPDGRQILTGDGNGQVEVWDAATGQQIRVLGTQGPGIEDVQFDSSGKYFVTTSSDGRVTVWSADDRRLHSFGACPSADTASLSPGGSQVVVACSGGSVPVFTAAGQETTVMSDPGVANSAAFSPNGRDIITSFGVDQTGGVRVWSSELASSSPRALEQLARQRIIGNLSAAQVNTALAGTSGWPSTP